MAITKTCDRCGDIINMNPMANTILPSFMIKKLNDFMRGWVDIDLCQNCEKELNAWLNNKQNKTVAYRKRETMND